MRVCDYRDVEVLPDSIVYCDIPYRGTRGYGDNHGRKNEFDYSVFYDWAESQDVPVFISEYWCPCDRFDCIAEFNRTSTLSATNNAKKEIEKIFIPKKWAQWWQERTKKPEAPKQLDLFDL